MVSTEAGVELKSFVVCNEESGTCQGRYDPEAMSASMGVIAMLSKVKNTCPTDLEPLQSFVDTDALDEFFEKSDLRAEYVSVTFPVDELTVSVCGSGQMAVTPRERHVDLNTAEVGQSDEL